MERLNAVGVPSGAILSLDAALAQPQARHRRVLEDVPVEGIGTVKLFGLTAKFSRTPGAIQQPPPRLSADTETILGTLGVSRDEVAALRAKGVV